MRYIQALMRESYITGVPMVEDKLLVGLVFMEDIVSALDCGWTESPVEKRMAKQAIVFEDDMPLPFAIFYLNKYRCGRYPAVNKKNELVEILSSKALAGTLLAEMNREILRLEKLH
ncbi:MAG: hypothetical protein LBB43_05400 [Spirochaetaceae bacterium]|jgi:predicted transcriptional regulator|nr:hypothetical protein [Spirochaetaceae bacterium]